VTRREVVFALTWQRNSEPVGAKMAALARWIGKRIGHAVVPRCALSYEELLPMFASDAVDVAWLPPLVYRHLARTKLARALVVNERRGRARFSAILVANRTSPHADLTKLAGARVAWVDPWSASGYVLPRLMLFERGLARKDTFLEERFFGSHDAALRSVVTGSYDLAATFAYFEGERRVKSGLDDVTGSDALILVDRLGEVPNDLIATRTGLDEGLRTALADAFDAALEDEAASSLLRGTLAVERFHRGEPNDELQPALDRARAAGLWTHL
jgi:phosphate/phosphite/phosphonate ABC transporter binding protein